MSELPADSEGRGELLKDGLHADRPQTVEYRRPLEAHRRMCNADVKDPAARHLPESHATCSRRNHGSPARDDRTRLRNAAGESGALTTEGRSRTTCAAFRGGDWRILIAR